MFVRELVLLKFVKDVYGIYQKNINKKERK